MTTWKIEHDPEEGWRVRKNRERKSVTHPDQDGALRHIRDKFQMGDKVVLIEEDGYQTVITRRVLSRGGWRR